MLSRIRGFRLSRATWLPALAGTSLVFVELVPRLTAPGSPFDEGFALTYGDQVLKGAVPGRDFMTFYGPLNPVALAGVFSVGGHSLVAERLLGLVYRLTVVAGILWLLRRRSLAASLSVTIAFAVLYLGEGLAAVASWGAVALVVVAVVCADAERPMLTGAAAVAVVLMRVDYVVAAAGAVVPFVVGWSREQRRRFMTSTSAGVGVLAAWLMLIGPSRLARLWTQLRISERGRHLPLPSPFSFPGNVFAIACVAIALLLVLGRRSRDARDGRLYLALGLAGVGLLPSTVQRPDAPHIVFFAASSAPVLPVLLRDVGRRAAGLAPRVRPSLSSALVVAITSAFVMMNLLHGSPLPLAVATKSSVIHNDGRTFRLADAELAAAFQAGLRRLDAIARPGQTVFVGPRDLRRTNVNDAFVYFLLPRLRPASYYIELDPHVTTVKGSGFLRQLAQSDFLVLSSDWDTWSEPNTSRFRDSSRPNLLVRQSFCRRGVFGRVEILQNCRLLRGRAADAFDVSGRCSRLRPCASTSTRSRPSRASPARPSRTTS